MECLKPHAICVQVQICAVAPEVGEEFAQLRQQGVPGSLGALKAQLLAWCWAAKLCKIQHLKTHWLACLCVQTALMCTAEAFSQLRGALLPLADRGGVQQPASSLLHQMLLKASADKRFIAEEVQSLRCAYAGHVSVFDAAAGCCIRYVPQSNLPQFDVDTPQAQRATAALAAGLSAEALPMLLPYVAHKNPKVGGAQSCCGTSKLSDVQRSGGFQGMQFQVLFLGGFCQAAEAPLKLTNVPHALHGRCEARRAERSQLWRRPWGRQRRSGCRTHGSCCAQRAPWSATTHPTPATQRGSSSPLRRLVIRLRERRTVEKLW
jgi:hypothetical protein